jgi:hypothetical protein
MTVPPPLAHYNGAAIVSETARLDEVTSDNTSLYAHPNEISFYPTPLCSSFDMLDDISWSDVAESGIPLPDDSLVQSSTPCFYREYHSLPDVLHADHHEPSLLLDTTTMTAGINYNSGTTCGKRAPRHYQHRNGLHRSSSPTGQSDCTSLPDLYLRRESGMSIMYEAAQALQAIQDDDSEHLMDPWMSAGPPAAAGSTSTAAAGTTAAILSAQEQQPDEDYNNASTIDPVPLQQVFRGGDEWERTGDHGNR